MLYSKIPLWLNFLIDLAVVILQRRLFYFMSQKTWCIILGALCVWTFKCSHVAQKGMQICWFWDSCWLVWGSPLLMKSFFCSLFSLPLPAQVQSPLSLLWLLFGFHGDQPKATSTHLLVLNVFFFSPSSVLHVLPYKAVLESLKGFDSLESLFSVLFFLFGLRLCS